MPEEAHSTIPPALCSVPQPIPTSKHNTDKSERGLTKSSKRLRKCHFCKKRKPVHYWLSESRCACHGCYQTRIRKGICSECGEEKRISKITEDADFLCHTCYQRERPEEICACCNLPGKIVQRLPDGRGIRSTCYQRERRRAKKAS
jgi:hypothetical protein